MPVRGNEALLQFRPGLIPGSPWDSPGGFFCPASFLAGVDLCEDERGDERGDECGYEYGSIHDDRHFRSAFLARRILPDDTRALVDAVRSRTLFTEVSLDGRDAKRSSSRRMNSCIDLPCRAARGQFISGRFGNISDSWLNVHATDLRPSTTHILAARTAGNSPPTSPMSNAISVPVSNSVGSTENRKATCE